MHRYFFVKPPWKKSARHAQQCLENRNKRRVPVVETVKPEARSQFMYNRSKNMVVTVQIGRHPRSYPGRCAASLVLLRRADLMVTQVNLR